MPVRRRPQHVDAGAMTVVLAIAIAIGALTWMTGFSPVSAMLVGTPGGRFAGGPSALNGRPSCMISSKPALERLGVRPAHRSPRIATTTAGDTFRYADSTRRYAS